MPNKKHGGSKSAPVLQSIPQTTDQCALKTSNLNELKLKLVSLIKGTIEDYYLISPQPNSGSPSTQQFTYNFVQLQIDILEMKEIKQIKRSQDFLSNSFDEIKNNLIQTMKYIQKQQIKINEENQALKIECRDCLEFFMESHNCKMKILTKPYEAFGYNPNFHFAKTANENLTQWWDGPRIRKPKRHPAIIIKFTSRKTRNEVYQLKKNLINKFDFEGMDTLYSPQKNIATLDTYGPNMGIYI